MKPTSALGAIGVSSLLLLGAGAIELDVNSPGGTVLNALGDSANIWTQTRLESCKSTLD